MPESQKIQAVFFDLDGTLIDTAPDMGGALNRLLDRHGRQAISPEHYRPHVSHGSIALLKLGFPEIANASTLHSLREDFLKEYQAHIAAESRLFDGMEPILRQLERGHIPWGIITNKPEYLTLSLLDQLDLANRCCCIVGADTAARAKPHPEPMELACRLTGVVAKRCLYLGDAERDIQAGKSVNMTTLVAGWGYLDKDIDDPVSWNADGYLSNPRDLSAFINDMIR